jgi:glycosyltransferase involved in cell wall biosynthesis
VHVAGVDELALRVRVPTMVYERVVGSLILRSSERVIAVSDAVAEMLGASVRPDRLVVVPNGVDHATFYPGRERRRDPPVIVFVGRLIANKGPQHLIEAVRALRSSGRAFEVRLIGDGPLRRSLEARVRELGLEALVRFDGKVSDVADRLRDADVFVRPSTSEGMSLALLEAMACGLCPVASDIPANAGVVAHGKTGILTPAGDERALAACLERLLADPPSRRRLGQAARAKALEYNWDGCARATALALGAAAGGRAGNWRR